MKILEYSVLLNYPLICDSVFFQTKSSFSSINKNVAYYDQ